MRCVLLLLLAASSIGVVACRRYAPVERHFLRVPAGYAAELSGIDREKWLKRVRKTPGTVKLAKESNYLQLPPGAITDTRRVPGGEVKFFPDEAGRRQGMVALHWPDAGSNGGAEGGRLWLLKTEGGRYVPQPLTRWLPPGREPWHYQLDASPNSITAWQEVKGSAYPKARPVVLHWRDGQWVPHL